MIRLSPVSRLPTVKILTLVRIAELPLPFMSNWLLPATAEPWPSPTRNSTPPLFQTEAAAPPIMLIVFEYEAVLPLPPMRVIVAPLRTNWPPLVRVIWLNEAAVEPDPTNTPPTFVSIAFPATSSELEMPPAAPPTVRFAAPMFHVAPPSITVAVLLFAFEPITTAPVLNNLPPFVTTRPLPKDAVEKPTVIAPTFVMIPPLLTVTKLPVELSEPFVRLPPPRFHNALLPATVTALLFAPAVLPTMAAPVLQSWPPLVMSRLLPAPPTPPTTMLPTFVTMP